ncbi:MAG TPA: response regulator transcription factor [Lysobacter sp.]|nr:response regulator transcription factor [Lysobacter sp.]
MRTDGTVVSTWEVTGPAITMHAAGTNTAPHVLVVDDDPDIAGLVSRYLGGQGLRVSIAADAAHLRESLARGPVDLILLDLGLPDQDGLLLLRELQDEWHGPVIVVSGRGAPAERVVGLELGADDYVTKPFELRELLARVRSVLRRVNADGAREPPAHTLSFDGMQLEPAARRLVDRDGRDVALTCGEFDLLLAMLARPNRVLSRDQLMNCMHGRDAGPFDRAIDVQVGRLRRKVELDAAHPRLIQSVRGAGYVLAATVTQG